jgi:hypothetical protein
MRILFGLAFLIVFSLAVVAIGAAGLMELVALITFLLIPFSIYVRLKNGRMGSE